MKKKFVFLEGIATADAAFEAYGTTIDELFQNAALALTTIQIELTSLKTTLKKEITLKENNEEKLLFAFLEELIFLKDTELFLPKKCTVLINKNFALRAVCKGETIDYERHTLGVDAKAVTYHQFEVKKEKKQWKCRVVIDI